MTAITYIAIIIALMLAVVVHADVHVTSLGLREGHHWL